MSLGDELRLLRARAGGPTPFEIEELTGVPARLYCQMEQRYREIGDDDALERLAAFFECDAAMLKRARLRSRKALSAVLAKARHTQNPLFLHLRTGETFSGLVKWWDLGAIGLEPQNCANLVVVQRHSVLDWSESG